ncbi:hypothetical protein SY88_12000 [Clostridiales bacterium PH28_bin88]|nr:hypothetical protein SY88_12000 [Clostridiales bacterium PH28_bin88]
MSGGLVIVTGVTQLLPGGKGAALGAAAGQKWADQWEEHHWGFVVDTRKCIGCGRCVRACKEENHVPLDDHVYRTWVERYMVDTNDRVWVDSPDGGLHGFPADREDVPKPAKSFFTPKLCNQCEKPPCVRVCPVAATYRTGDGVTLVDQERCIGCRYCIQACPYGARFLHPELKVADKCTWCYHRITKGMLPACVQVCPVGARVFGDLEQPDSPVRAILESERVNVLKPAMGTEPRVYYLGLDKVVG